MDNHSIDAFDIVSNASTNLECHEDEIVPFENPKDDYQIDTLAGDSLISAVDSKGNPQLSDLQTKVVFSRYEEEGEEQKVYGQQLNLYFHLTEEEQSTFNFSVGTTRRLPRKTSIYKQRASHGRVVIFHDSECF
jgi:hypothetical protein